MSLNLYGLIAIAAILFFPVDTGSGWDRSWQGDHKELVVKVGTEGEVEVFLNSVHVVQDFTYFVTSQNGKFSLKHREVEFSHKENKWGRHPGFGQSREGSILDYPKAAFSLATKLDSEPGSLTSFLFITEGSDGYYLRIVTMFPLKNPRQGESEL